MVRIKQQPVIRKRDYPITSKVCEDTIAGIEKTRRTYIDTIFQETGERTNTTVSTVIWVMLQVAAKHPKEVYYTLRSEIWKTKKQ